MAKGGGAWVDDQSQVYTRMSEPVANLRSPKGRRL